MFIEVDHPCIKAKMTVLRNKNTNPKEFRERAEEITCFLAYEALKNLPLTETTVETPLETTVGYTVENDIVVVPVLRAGVGMLGGIQSLIPTVKVGFVGLQRDHDTKHPVKYYLNLPKPSAEAFAIIIDPMLATGGSLSAAVSAVKESGFRHIVVLTIVSAPEGVQVMEKNHPDVKIYSAALDRELNASKYILPGLGDAGDRLFGTL